MVKQTAGRDILNDFAPQLAELNDDVLRSGRERISCR